MCGSRKFCQGGGGSNYDKLFSDNEGERIQIPLKVGHHSPDSETPFKFAGEPDYGPTLNADFVFRGSGPVLLKNLYL